MASLSVKNPKDDAGIFMAQLIKETLKMSSSGTQSRCQPVEKHPRQSHALFVNPSQRFEHFGYRTVVGLSNVGSVTGQPMAGLDG